MASPLSKCITSLLSSSQSLANATYNIDFHATLPDKNHVVSYVNNTSLQEAQFELFGRIVKIIPPVMVDTSSLTFIVLSHSRHPTMQEAILQFNQHATLSAVTRSDEMKDFSEQKNPRILNWTNSVPGIYGTVHSMLLEMDDTCLIMSGGSQSSPMFSPNTEDIENENNLFYGDDVKVTVKLHSEDLSAAYPSVRNYWIEACRIEKVEPYTDWLLRVSEWRVGLLSI